ncbi:taste receptor type 2 member 1-like [Aquarana catesbeiana]|uniref:taste receptor type 2 member 1-like n=1 Tax=Aquarana catesbeiana TaxID=8400 RepID=UPI003CCA2871
MYKPDNQTQQVNSQLPPPGLSPYECLSLSLLALETLIGTLVNGYIAIVFLLVLVTQKKLGSGNIILTCLSLSRFGFQFLVLGLYLLSYVFSDAVNSQSSINNLQYVWLFFHNINIWLTALLSTFYCVRIVNIQQCIFVFLKTHFDRCVPYFILASAGISALCSNSYTYTSLNNVFNVDKFDKNNRSSPFILGGSDFATFSATSAVSTAPPFLLFCVSSGLVVGSLFRHMRKVKGQERTGFREPSLHAHYRAVKMLGAFLIFFSLYTLAFNLYVSGILVKGMEGSFCTMVIGAYPSLHSLVLAIGNPKLKQTFMKILQKGHCYCCQAEATQIETINY